MYKHKYSAIAISSFIFIALTVGMFASINEASAESEGVAAIPVADFTYDVIIGGVPLTVQFTDTSTESPNSWLWEFGDEGTSTEQNPEHIYAISGTYTVKLTATNTTGTHIKTIEVNVYYTITFNSNGGSDVTDITQADGTDITRPEDPTKEGYTFTGWNPAVPTTMPANDITLTATWKINKYTITFVTGGGTPIDPINLVFGSVVTEPADPTREGYTFSNWNPAVPAKIPAENVTITAVWNVNPYTITFDSAGGSSVTSITQNYGTEIIAPADPTREGYTFNGWNPAVPTTMPANDITLTATWKINKYTITFVTGGGTPIDPINLVFGSVVTEPADPTREGYTFSNWNPAVPAKIPAENVTITAVWNVNPYTITFDSAGGSSVTSITQNYGTEIIAPADPTREGYTFSNWNPAVPMTMPAENKTITAIWTINSYTITFDTDGGTVIDSITLNFGSMITSPENPTREGYTFDGWDPEVPTTMPAENLTIVAQWLIDRTITFDTADGSKVDAITQGVGSTVTPPENPIREGFIFSEWDPVVPTTMPAEDIVITAVWTFDSHSIIFDSAGGSEVAAITQGVGSTVTPPEDPTREGYIFLHWNPTVPLIMPAEKLVITAIWTFDSHSIIFDSAGGSKVDAITQGVGSTVTPPEGPTREGYIFSHWNPTVPTIMPAEDTVITAKWNVMLVPVADFEVNVTRGVKPLTVKFTDTSTQSPNSWLWDFGDDVTSTDQSPEHTFTESGTYVVTLMVTNDIGSNMKTMDIEVTSGAIVDDNNNIIIAMSIFAIITVLAIVAILLLRRR